MVHLVPRFASHGQVSGHDADRVATLSVEAEGIESSIVAVVRLISFANRWTQQRGYLFRPVKQRFQVGIMSVKATT